MRHISAVEAARATGRDSDILADSASRRALSTLGTQQGLGVNGSTDGLALRAGRLGAGTCGFLSCTGTAVGDFNMGLLQVAAHGGDTPRTQNS